MKYARKTIKKLFLVAIAALLFSFDARAQDTGFFAGLDATAGWASGSSNTRNGGAAFAGGGVVDNVKFDTMPSVGGHLGYRLNPGLSALLSYQHARGAVRWDAHFPGIASTSSFDGMASSNAVLAKLELELALSSSTSFMTSAGIGLSFNTLSEIVETDKTRVWFLSHVAEHTRMSPAVQLGAGIRHRLSPGMALDLNASVSYIGAFETGDTRSGNLGVTGITPYRIDDVWSGNLGGSMRVSF